MVLSHGCEIDKPDANVCLVSRVRPITDQREKFQERIRSGRIANVMYLPSEGRLDESYVDFRYIYRLPYKQIGATRFDQAGQRGFEGTDGRRCSLSDEGQQTLHGAIARFFLRPDQPLNR
jgi:hypothetical protein